MSEVLVPELRPGQVVVLDNLPAHEHPEIQRAIEGAGCRLLFLPRYSPEFNPIALFWSKLKSELRSQAARTLESLQAAVADASEAITAENARGWLAHAGYPPPPGQPENRSNIVGPDGVRTDVTFPCGAWSAPLP